MEALVVIDAQNDFSPQGALPVAGHAAAVVAIGEAVSRARSSGHPVFWIRHENPEPNGRFQHGTWGAELDPSLLPLGSEPVLTKTVFGAFTGTPLESALREQSVDAVRLAGFLTHMCVSTTTREALMLGVGVTVDAPACGSTAIEAPGLGRIEAEEAHRAALLHLSHMGAKIEV